MLTAHLASLLHRKPLVTGVAGRAGSVWNQIEKSHGEKLPRAPLAWTISLPAWKKNSPKSTGT